MNYSSEVRGVVEGFDKKDQMELMSINKNGEVTLSSSGFSPDKSYNMPDYEAALESDEGIGVFMLDDGVDAADDHALHARQLGIDRGHLEPAPHHLLHELLVRYVVVHIFLEPAKRQFHNRFPP